MFVLAGVVRVRDWLVGSGSGGPVNCLNGKYVDLLRSRFLLSSYPVSEIKVPALHVHQGLVLKTSRGDPGRSGLRGA